MAHNRTPHLFDHWDDIARRIRAADGVYLFLDFDGTLVPFCFGPDQVRLGRDARRVLARLTQHRHIRLAIVSGRRRSELIHYVNLPRIRFLGLYGWDSKAHSRLPRRTARKLAGVRAALANLPAEVPGVRTEDKVVSFAIHFRGASVGAARRARARVRRLLAPLAPDLHVIRGNDVWEVVAREVRGKGAAVRDAIAGSRTTVLPIYLGDDLTDEPGFAAARDGIAVLVGPRRRTSAHFRLRGPEEVRLFLERLESEFREKS